VCRAGRQQTWHFAEAEDVGADVVWELQGGTRLLFSTMSVGGGGFIFVLEVVRKAGELVE
jgi:hypothetical protein